MRKNWNKGVQLGLILVIVVIGFAIDSCTHQPYVMPEALRTGDPTICFETDILPIFISNCAKSGCHDQASGKGGYVLTSYSNIVKKGIIPGNVAASKIWQTIDIKKLGITTMPPNGAGLSNTDIDLLRRWIATGAIDSGGACSISTCDSNNYTYSGAIQPLTQKYCTGCHNSASASGGSLMDYTSVMNAAVNGRLLGDIEHLSGYNAMPLGGISLSDCEIAQFKKWVAAGALNN